jgi:hypothetical protein
VKCYECKLDITDKEKVEVWVRESEFLHNIYYLCKICSDKENGKLWRET